MDIGIEKRKPKPKWVPIVLSLFLFIVLVSANFLFMVYPDRYVNRDFMSLWSGGRAVLKGLDPYDPLVWKMVRSNYGSTWFPDARAPYPLWTFLSTAILALLPTNYAAATWITLSELVLGLSLFYLVTRNEQEKVSMRELVMILLGGFVFRGVVVTLLNGQITIVLLAIIILFIHLMRRGYTFWAGFALSFILLKPTPFILFAPITGLWLVARRYWGVIKGGLAGCALLMIGSWIVQPGWIFDWLHVKGKTYVTHQTPTVWGLAYEASPDWWLWLGIGLTTLITAGLAWYVARNANLKAADVVALALPVSLFIAPYAWAYEHALLLIPITMIYQHMRRSRVAHLLWLGLTIFLPWLLFSLALKRGVDTASFLLPLVTAGLFLITLRPARGIPAVDKAAISP